jgi:hypothetical protein
VGESQQSVLPAKVDTYLRSHLSPADYLALEPYASVVTHYDSLQLNVWQIPIHVGSPSYTSVLIETNMSDECLAGRIVGLQQAAGSDSSRFQGSINISSLDRRPMLASSVVSGYIVALHPTLQTVSLSEKEVSQAPVVPADAGGTVLPECIVVGYVSPSTGVLSYSTYVNLLSLLGSGSGGGSSSSGGTGASSSGGGDAGDAGVSGMYSNAYVPFSGSGSVQMAQMIRIDSEDGSEEAPIDLAAYIKCFGAIPDNESTTYTVTIMADIPVDNNPNDLFNYSSMSPGHAFIAFSKQNGAQIITQNIGFYPNGSFKDFKSCAPVASKFSDNQYHEFNASLKMPVSGSKFQDALNVLVGLKDKQYDIDQYNCTDLALQVFNSARSGTSLTIPQYHIPGSPMSKSNTPQGLYFELNSMKVTHTPEENNISAGSLKQYAGPSHGPCN